MLMATLTATQMEDKIDAADKKVLVDIVKLTQKRGLKGSLGDWKEFLKSYDKKFGACLSDPSKRSHEVLAAFLKTFSKEDDLKFFANIMRHHSNQYMLERLKDKPQDSPEQRLVQITLQHPLYPLDYSSSSINEDWVVTNLKRKLKRLKSTPMIAVDCEMVLCEDYGDALVKICVVDQNLEVKLNELVKPSKAVIDYRTEITGVSSQDLEGVTCSLSDIQKSMKKLLSNGTILVGHSLHNDLRVLKLDHVRVVDTSYIFQSSYGSTHRRPSLNSLCKAVLGYEVRRDGAPHNCLDDACAAMKLALAKIKHGVDKEFPLVQEHVSGCETEKLLIHRIPTTVNSETLHEVVPGDFKIELKASRKGPGEKYSVFAIYKNPQEAHDAYENLQGSQSKDSFGRLQKLVMFRLSTGESGCLFVRKMTTESPHGSLSVPKMTADEPHNQTSSKRPLEIQETIDVSKKTKTAPKTEDDTCPHLNEIEALNQRLKQNELEIEALKNQLTQKDFDVTMLHKMISSLKKRT